MEDSTEKSVESEARASCWRCGKIAVLQCSGCKEGRYCSKQCQMDDFIDGGHKVLCQGPPLAIKINIILRELFSAEYAWLKALDPAVKARFFYFKQDADQPINHLVISGEVALVLTGVNAASLLTKTMRTWIYDRAYYENVLSPWYEKHKDFLNQEGFYVDFITHNVFLYDVFCPCVDENGSPCGKLGQLAQNTGLFKDARSPKRAMVDKIFAVEKPEKPDDWKDEDIVKHQDMMECVAFKAAMLEEEGKEIGMRVQYNFDWPAAVFGCDDDVCCSPCQIIEPRILPQDATALGLHFQKARKAMASIGFPIFMQMKDLDGWSDAQIAKVWFTGAGSITVFTKWLENDDLPFVIADDHRYDRIIRHVYQLGLPAE